MKYFKKILRLIGLVLFLSLAMLGISLGGGIPIPVSHRKENQMEIRLELPEEKETKYSDESISAYKG